MKWGILSTGTIAKNFAQTAKQMPDVQVQAVASRSAGSAKAFAEAFVGMPVGAHPGEDLFFPFLHCYVGFYFHTYHLFWSNHDVRYAVGVYSVCY